MALAQLPEPLQLGPVLLRPLTVAGGAHAMAFLASVALAMRLARRADVPQRAMLEAHALAVPVALLASRAPAVARAFPRVLGDGRALAGVVAADPDGAWSVVAVLAVALLMAWASRRPLQLLDALAPGASLACGVMLALPVGASWRLDAAALALGAAGAVAGAAVLSPRAPGRAAAAAMALASAAAGAVALPEGGVAAALRTPRVVVAGAAALVLLVLACLPSRRRASDTEERPPHAAGASRK